jgi:hypothetical protein
MKRHIILIGSIIGTVLVIVFGSSAAKGEIAEGTEAKGKRAERLVIQSKVDYGDARMIFCEAIDEAYSECRATGDCKVYEKLKGKYITEFYNEPLEDCLLPNLEVPDEIPVSESYVLQ